MVKEDVKQNIFTLWSDEIDLVKRSDVKFWSPDFLNIINTLNNLEAVPLYNFSNSFVNGSTPDNLSGKFSEKEEILFLRNGNIKDIELNLEDKKFITETNHQKNNRSKLKKFDVLVSIAGTIGNASIFLEEMEANINQNICRISPKNINPFYLTVFLNTKYGKNQLLRNASVQTIMYVNNDVIKNTTIPTFSENKQIQVEKKVLESFKLKKEAQDNYQKAADIFNKELNKYLDISKKEKSFIKWSNEIEILDRIDPFFYFENEYEKNPKEFVLLGDVADVLIGKTPAFDDYVESGNRIMKFRAIRGNGIDWENEERGFVKEKISNKYKNSLEQDNIILGCAAHQASYIGSKIDIVDYMPDEFKKVFTVAEIISIKAKLEINPYALLLFMRSQVGYELIQRQVKGQTSHLYPKDVKKIKIPKDLLKLSKSSKGEDIEKLIKLSLKEKREAKNKLEEAKQYVEGLIDKNKR